MDLGRAKYKTSQMVYRCVGQTLETKQSSENYHVPVAKHLSQPKSSCYGVILDSHESLGEREKAVKSPHHLSFSQTFTRVCTIKLDYELQISFMRGRSPIQLS